MPSGVTAWVSEGETILAAARNAGVPIAASCAGRGTCGECGVRLVSGVLQEADAVEKRGLTRAPDGVRLACQARVSGHVTVQPLISLGVQAEQFDPVAGAELVAAIDLGTTMVGAVVIDRKSGREIGRSTVANQQSVWGADVLSRLSASVSGEDTALRESAERSIVAALEAAAPELLLDISRLVIAGNTAMEALLAGADVSSLATYPFVIPRSRDALSGDSSLWPRLRDGVRIEVVPPMASFVGGDVLAGLVAMGIAPGGHPVMLVDVGTNAEVVLATKKELFVASAAAGPAFEGGGVSSGGPAIEGAVSSVRIHEDGGVHLETIGDAGPKWFSGAGLVSAVAALRRVGHLDSSGLLDEKGPLRDRFTQDGEGVLGVDLGDDTCQLRVTQLDVRTIQLAKAAVRAAVQLVLSRAGVRARKLSVLYIAGAFGGALEVGDLVELGVVPEQSGDVVEFVGNTSLRGAAVLALDDTLWSEARSLAASALHVDLAVDPEFNTLLIEGVELEPFHAR